MDSSSNLPPSEPLARLITDELPSHARRFDAAGHTVSVRSGAVEVDGHVRAVTPAGMAMLRRLLVRPGWVVSSKELLAQLPRGHDTHAVQTAVSRLRSALGAPSIIQTVRQRGYRLAIDPAERDEQEPISGRARD